MVYKTSRKKYYHSFCVLSLTVTDSEPLYIYPFKVPLKQFEFFYRFSSKMPNITSIDFCPWKLSTFGDVDDRWWHWCCIVLLTGNQKSWMVYKTSRKKYYHSFCVLSLTVTDIFHFDHIFIKVSKISNMIINTNKNINKTIQHQVNPRWRWYRLLIWTLDYSLILHCVNILLLLSSIIKILFGKCQQLLWHE
jgi:hypothetical protein